MDEKVLYNDVFDYFVLHTKEMKNLSYSHAKNYLIIKDLIYNYDEELNKVLHYGRHYEIRKFFREHNDVLKRHKYFFNDMNDKNLLHILNTLIQKQINKNLILAKKHLVSKQNSTQK